MPTTRILIVEDDTEILGLLERFLSSDGYEVVTSANVEDATALLQGPSGFDLVVCDFFLHPSTATALLDHVSATHPNLPIVLISGGKDEVPIETVHAIGKVSGALSFLQKPFPREELWNAVKGALNRR